MKELSPLSAVGFPVGSFPRMEAPSPSIRHRPRKNERGLGACVTGGGAQGIRGLHDSDR